MKARGRDAHHGAPPAAFPMPGATSPTAANADGELVLHRWPARWGLPSLSPECVAVETYLRLAGLKFSSEACATPYVSPSGLLPALDQCADVVGVDGATAADGADGADAYDDAGGAACKADGSLAMAQITTHLRAKVADLDSNAAVSESDRATLVAFLALAESRLATATTYYTWIDRDRFRAHTREAYGAAFPAPMSYILPWLWRRGVMRRHRSSGGSFSEGGEEGVTRGVRDAYAALERRLMDSGGPFFFGKTPTSLDALVFAHLSYHARAPVGDALRVELKKHPGLVTYVEEMRRVPLTLVPIRPRPRGGTRILKDFLSRRSFLSAARLDAFQLLRLTPFNSTQSRLSTSTDAPPNAEPRRLISRRLFPSEDGSSLGEGGDAAHALDSSAWIEPPTASKRDRARGWWGSGGGKEEKLTAKEIAFRRRSRYSGAFSSITLVPIRARSRGERRSLRTFARARFSPPPLAAFNPDTHRRLSTPSDAFELHPDVASYGTTLVSVFRRRRGVVVSVPRRGRDVRDERRRRRRRRGGGR